MAEAVASVLIAAVVGPVVVLFFQRRWKDETASGQADLVSKIGEPNGHVSLVAMAQSLIDGQTRQDERLARMEERQAGTDASLMSIQLNVAAAAEHGVETRKLMSDHLAAHADAASS